MNRSLGMIVTAGFVAAAGCTTTVETASAPAPTTDPMAAAPAPTIGDELQISEVAVYQAVKASVVKDGALVPLKKQNAPIIAGRPAFVRVWVKPLGRTRPSVDGELHVKRAGKPDLVLKDGGKAVVPDLDDSALEQTLNFAIPAEDMTADASFSVKAAKTSAPTDVLAFPADGTTTPFAAKTASKKLRVEFVPVSYEVDPTAPLVPDLGDQATLRDTLYKMYPVGDVEITVREAFKWSSVVKASGTGWDALLGGIMQLRRADHAEADVYYVGVFTPSASLDEFCSSGVTCILGVAPQADENSVNMRAALVLGYKNRGAGSTLAQELAHAMGRLHAPCGVTQAVDDSFPYSNGGIGVWGYDILKKALIDPGNRYRDFMSYCGPTWTSDYTFAGLYDRMDVVSQQIAAAAAATPPPPSGSGSAGMRPQSTQTQTELRHSFTVATDGTMTQGPDLEVLPGASGEQSGVSVSYEGANGKVFATAKGRVVPVSGTGSRIVLVATAPAGATHARLAGLGITALRTTH